MQIDVNQLMSELKQMDLAGELGYAIPPINDSVLLINQMAEDGLKFDETNNTLIAARDGELAPGGRLGQISSKYGALIGEASAVNQGKFDLASGKALMYLGDIVNIMPVLKQAYEIAMGLIWLENGTALILAKNNFLKARFSANLIKEVDADIVGVYNLVSSKHENELDFSLKFQNMDITDPNIKAQYIKALEMDFELLAIKYLPRASIVVDSYSRVIRCYQSRYNQLKTVDDYSARVQELMKKVADIEISLAACDIFFGMPKAIPQSQEGKALLEIVNQLVLAFQKMAQAVLKTYDDFKKKGSDAPYCFMNNPDHIGSFSGYGLENLIKDDPIKSGTHLMDNYQVLFKAIKQYREQFVTGFGRIK